MKTVTEAAKITGIIPQRINDYEKAGLLKKPTARNKYKYRLYSDKEIIRLWQIRFYKELGYTIPQMKKVFDNPDYRPDIELREQIRGLEERKKQIDALLVQARVLQQTGLDVSLSYELIPAVRDFTYDEAAEIVFAPWSKGALAGIAASEHEGDDDDGLFEDLSAVVEQMKEGVSPLSTDVQAQLRILKHRHGIPLASIQVMLRMKDLKELLLELYGEETTRALTEAVKTAAQAEAAEAQAQAEISVSKLLTFKNRAPDSAEVQAEVAALLKAASFGLRFPESSENPAAYEIEVIEGLMKQYADRNSAFFTSALRRRLERIERKKGAGKAGPGDVSKAKAETDRLHAQVSETLVPALQAYLKNISKTGSQQFPDGSHEAL